MKGIGKRVAAGFFSIVALLFISGMISLFELSNLSTDTEDILSASRRNMESAKEMLNSAHQHSLAVMHIAIFNEHSREDACRRAISDLEGRVAMVRNEALDVTRLDTLAGCIDSLRHITDNYLAARKIRIATADTVVVIDVSTAQAIANNVSQNEITTTQPSISGRQWYDTEYKAAYDNLTNRIQDFMTHTHSSLAPRAEQLNKNAYRSVTPIFISLIVMILTVLMFYYFMRTYCVKPVEKIDKALSDYLSYRLPFSVKNNLIDEYKSLHDNIETLINISKQNNINKQ